MTKDEKFLLAEWMSQVNAIICYMNDVPTCHKQPLLDLISEFKKSAGIPTYDEPETT